MAPSWRTSIATSSKSSLRSPACSASSSKAPAPWSKEYTMVLANPPFGKKQSLLFVNEEGETEKDDQVIVREDFWTSTSNKQLNFVQHIYSLLKINGRAAVVVPDNVLFEGGAGEKVRRNLLRSAERRVGKECRSRWS